MPGLHEAVSVLGAVSSSTGERLVSLRFLQAYLTDPASPPMPVMMRSRVNELVLDNVLKLVMN